MVTISPRRVRDNMNKAIAEVVPVVIKSDVKELRKIILSVDKLLD